MSTSSKQVSSANVILSQSPADVWRAVNVEYPGVLMGLLARLKISTFQPDEVILEYNDTSYNFYIVRKLEAKLHADHD
eukprot:427045-Hanusia_phi.AAC.5